MALKIHIPPKYFLQFPWLNGSYELLFEVISVSKDVVEESSIVDIVKIIFNELPKLKFRIMQLFVNIAESVEEIPDTDDNRMNLAMYPVIQIIMGLLGNRILANGLSNTYAKNCQSELKHLYAKKEINDSFIQKLCANVGIKCMTLNRHFIDGTEYQFAMDFSSYLHASTKINAEIWKLINRILDKGNVYLIRHDVILLLREYVRQKTLPDFSQMDEKLKENLEQIPEIKEIIEKISEIVAQNTQRFQSSLMVDGETIGSDLFAPCIKAILHRAVQGENLSHNERLAIAFYYLNTNHSIEETVDIFRTSPDFDEKIARYQVEFAAGRGGKGKKYSMFKCSKLKSLHLCYADHKVFGDELCKDGARKRNGEIVKIKNPAHDFVFWAKVRMNRIHRSQIAALENTFDENDSNSQNPQNPQQNEEEKK
jgi:DNA primase large subunit